MPSEQLPLRDRKKARTRADIQRHAIRLFRTQGYEATTVSQIAAAAEISDSTFFRYFPTKEDVVTWDALDPDILDAIRSQPAALGPISAIRRGFRQVFGGMSREARTEVRERLALVLSIHPVRVLGSRAFGPPLAALAGIVAARTGGEPDDVGIRALIGAVVGACLAVAGENLDEPDADLGEAIDRALAALEAGWG